MGEDIYVKEIKTNNDVSGALIKIDPGYKTITIDRITTIDRIGQIAAIAPVAAHIKEVNHIDPLSIEALHVSQVKNVEPLKIERLNVTNLPLVNLSMRDVPPLAMDVRHVPPLSISTHQHFEIPSRYTLRARFFGIEFLNLLLTGQSMLIPHERYRQEQERSPERSFPLVAAAGNPAIPIIREEKCVTVQCPPPPALPPPPAPHMGPMGHAAHHLQPGYTGYAGGGTLHWGAPAMSFHIPGEAGAAPGGSSVRSGG